MVDRLVSVDDETGRLPQIVRERLAQELMDAESEIGGELSATFVSKVRPLGGGANDAPQINTILAAPRPAGVQATVVFEGDFLLGSHIAVPANTTLDARAATFKALSGCGYMLQTAAMEKMLLAPREAAATPSATGGTLAAGTYYYRVSIVTTVGETVASLQVTATTTGSTGSVALKWRTPRVGPIQTITHYKIWRGTTAGVSDKLLATIPAVNPVFDQDVFWTDTGVAGATGSFPVMNTTFGRTEGVSVIGGVWDSNRLVNGGGGEGWQAAKFIGHGFNLQKVDNTLIRDVKVKNAAKWAIAVADYTNLVTENLSFDTNSDGIHVLGPGKGWRGRGFYGHVGDDLVGISLVEWPNQTPSEGDITDVDLSGLHGVDAPSALRMLMGTGRKFDGIKISGVRGEYTQYRDGTTGEYTYAGVGVVFLNADNNNPGRRGGSFGNVTFEDIRPNAHQSDVVQVDGTGESLTVRNVVVKQSGRHALRIGKEIFDAARTTAIKKVVVDDPTVQHSNAARGVYAGQSNTVVDDLIVNRPVSNHAGTANSMAVELNGCTVKRLKVHNPVSVHGVANGVDIATLTNATVEDVLVTGAVAEKINSIVYLNGGTYSKVAVTDTRIKDGQAVVKTKCPVDVIYSNIDANTLTNGGVVALFTAAATPVTVTGSGLRRTGADPLTRDGSQVVRTRSLTTEADVSRLKPSPGDAAFNTNAGLSCGVGPVLSNGTEWKSLYNASVYPVPN